ncbi:hypothetical protein AAES_141986 [Amazona aestiva]|uniref:Uncharacterized protein n=1 Tax=Amazona aestiva TaxID=12930 RepID=A0A0Q3LZR0_AMAAE|nr:hypothetical protein AAES_141986 [Amazona aestiva]
MAAKAEPATSHCDDASRSWFPGRHRVVFGAGPQRLPAKFVKPYRELDRQVGEPDASAAGADLEDAEQNVTEEEKKEWFVKHHLGATGK